MKAKTEILLAPLQGLTDHYFRNAYQKYFGDVDGYYAPWIKLDGAGQIKNSYIKDLDPENNKGIPLVPQVMCNNTHDFVFLANYLNHLGYEEINWNLGCPHPMITNRGMGAALLKEPEKIISILKDALPQIPIEVSLKARLGFNSVDEINQLLPRLDKFPLKEIIIHARTADQMYKGNVNLNAFSNCLKLSEHALVYNGDISSYNFYKELNNRFPQVNKWMIGRGLIANPFLAGMIKEGNDQLPENHKEHFRAFHDQLLEGYASHLSGEKHLLLKMLAFWQYFSISSRDSHKALKRIKKAKTLKSYQEAVQLNMEHAFQNSI